MATALGQRQTTAADSFKSVACIELTVGLHFEVAAVSVFPRQLVFSSTAVCSFQSVDCVELHGGVAFKSPLPRPTCIKSFCDELFESHATFASLC